MGGLSAPQRQLLRPLERVQRYIGLHQPGHFAEAAFVLNFGFSSIILKLLLNETNRFNFFDGTWTAPPFYLARCCAEVLRCVVDFFLHENQDIEDHDGIKCFQ